MKYVILDQKYLVKIKILDKTNALYDKEITIIILIINNYSVLMIKSMTRKAKKKRDKIQ